MIVIKKIESKSYVKYFEHGIVWSGFQSAHIFSDVKKAKEAIKTIHRAEYEREQDFTMFEIINIPAMPESQEFKEAFPLSRSSIPKRGKKVYLIYRDGSKSGVSGDFLVDEMEAGRWIHSKEFCRWNYSI